MKKKAIGLNAVLNALKTLSSVIFPLITFPYISRVLHVDNMGIYNFSYSLVNYFALLGSLGIGTYAIREGARYREDAGRMSGFASEVFSINVIATAAAYILLFAVMGAGQELAVYRPVVYILSISILFTAFGCEWIFSIYEEFGYIAIRSILFQILSMILLFAFVKDENCLPQYAMITVFAASGANLINGIVKRKYCTIRLVFNRNMIRHLKPIFLLLANTIATTIYINSDITILGLMVGDYYVGLYSVSTKVYTMVKTMIGALITVSIPRLAAELGKKDRESFEQTANKIFNTLLLIALPAAAGSFGIAGNIVFLLAGEEYMQAKLSLQVLSAALLFCTFSWFFTSCILIPERQERKVLYATVLAAGVNAGLNILLIPFFRQNAAAFTTAISELLSAVVTWWWSRTYFKAKVGLRNLFSLLAGSAAVLVVCMVTGELTDSVIGNTVLTIAVSSAVYYGILKLTGNTIIDTLPELFRIQS